MIWQGNQDAAPFTNRKRFMLVNRGEMRFLYVVRLRRRDIANIFALNFIRKLTINASVLSTSMAVLPFFCILVTP